MWCGDGRRGEGWWGASKGEGWREGSGEAVIGDMDGRGCWGMVWDEGVRLNVARTTARAERCRDKKRRGLSSGNGESPRGGSGLVMRRRFAWCWL